MNDFSYTIVSHLATLSSIGTWSLELNLISWGGRPATFDLRKWNADHTRMSKGITLSRAELQTLADFVNNEAA